MKKLFSMAAIFIMALTLAACTNDEEISNELSFIFTSEYEVTTTENVSFEDEYEGSFKDLLILNFDFDYTDTDYGAVVNSIENLNPKTGAYVAVLKNGTMSDVGIDLIEFEDGDSFEFQVIWWNQLQKDVDDLIQLFIENHASDYVNSEFIDYNVILGLNLLGIENDFVSKSEVEELVESSVLTSVADYFKAIMMLNSVEADSSELLRELNLIVTPGPYGQTAYGLLAMDSVSHTEDYSAFVTAAMSDLETTTPYDLGLDAGGISLVALSNYSGVDTLAADYVTWINNSQINSGGILTRDVVWGETTYPGTENAASISQVILGLLAYGIEPSGNLFTKVEGNLVSRLVEFGTDTGSFDYVLTDGLTEDLFFSTPQAFLALVAYQEYSNTYSAVNPFDFN